MSTDLASWQQLRARVGVRLIADTTVERISLELARSHLRITPYGSDNPPSHPDDPWLEAVGIPAARDYCERYMARSIGAKTYELARSGFPGAPRAGEGLAVGSRLPWAAADPSAALIELPFGPVRSVSSVEYVDGAGLDQAVGSEYLDLDSYLEPARLSVAYGRAWPAARASANSVRVRYSAGYTTPDDDANLHPLPPAILAAMLLMLGHLYENREASFARAQQELPLGVASLLDPYVLSLSMA